MYSSFVMITFEKQYGASTFDHPFAGDLPESARLGSLYGSRLPSPSTIRE